MKRKKEAPEEMLDEIAVEDGWSWFWSSTGNCGVIFLCLCEDARVPACVDEFGVKLQDVVVRRLRVDVVDESNYFKSCAQGFEESNLERSLSKYHARFRWWRYIGALIHLIVIDV